MLVTLLIISILVVLLLKVFFTDRFFTAQICPPHTVNSTLCTDLSNSNWDKTGIAWDTDLQYRFIPRKLKVGETNMNPRGFTMPAMNDEDLVVWMRASTLPTFTKLYRQINDRKLSKNEILRVRVANTFPTWKWNGQKALVVSTANFLGGSSSLGAVYLVVGCLSLVLAIFFRVKTQQMVKDKIPTERLLASELAAVENQGKSL